MSVAKTGTQEIELDLGRYELRRAGRRVKLEKKPMELLIFLVGRRPQLVSREDIVKRLWRTDLFVDTETNINNIVRKLRTALGDNYGRSRFIETVVGKGYRFVGPVRVIEAQYPTLRTAAASGTWNESSPGAGLRPALAVLPLLFVGKGTDDEGICLGFADALTSSLANAGTLDVLPTSTVLNVPLDQSPAKISARLSVRFVVHGAIQAAKGNWQLSLELFDAQLQRPCYTRKCAFGPDRLALVENEIAREVAGALKQPLPTPALPKARYTRDPVAYAEFIRGYKLSASGDDGATEKAIHHFGEAVTRDPAFALAHANLSLACASRHFESDPTSAWLDKAEFHCRRALEIDSSLAEAHVARAFLLWGPSKNFQHLEAIAELKRALSLQKNLPHAYNRLGTILAHIGLLGRAREMYERGRMFNPGKVVSRSIVQVHIWDHELDRARDQIQAWRAESPGNKYAIYFAPQPALMTGEWKEADALVEEARRLLPEEPLIISLQGVFYALTGRSDAAQACAVRACASPKSFGHAHHTYYQIACIHALTGQPQAAAEWLERSVSSGFACWPFISTDPWLADLHRLTEFDGLISSLKAKYPDELGVL